MKPESDKSDEPRMFWGHTTKWWLDIEAVMLQYDIADGAELSSILSSAKPRAPGDWSGY